MSVEQQPGYTSPGNWHEYLAPATDSIHGKGPMFFVIPEGLPLKGSEQDQQTKRAEVMKKTREWNNGRPDEQLAMHLVADLLGTVTRAAGDKDRAKELATFSRQITEHPDTAAQFVTGQTTRARLERMVDSMRKTGPVATQKLADAHPEQYPIFADEVDRLTGMALYAGLISNDRKTVSDGVVDAISKLHEAAGIPKHASPEVVGSAVKKMSEAIAPIHQDLAALNAVKPSTRIR